MAQAYILSRVMDPIFAVVIGTSAAALRINREGHEQGRTGLQTIQTGLRRLGLSREKKSN